jgi:hypothetical protein|tara:strand:- start:285 stop:911 length:627 start_codon:yes stop_codon:yes gene_type:complete
MQDLSYNNEISIFNKELLELLCQNDSKIEQVNTCLISNLPLDCNHITLSCGHKFNYKSIYSEVKNQKKYSHLETQKLKNNQIKCPYCRNIQNGLLPHYGNFTKINGINWPPSKQFKPNNCLYKYISGKKKGLACDKKCLNKYCPSHEKIINKRKEKQEKQNDINVIIPNTCAYVFKRGKNKGNTCKCKKKFNNSSHCKEHFKYFSFII